MSITTVGDHLIHYEALGRGEPVIFVHGWLGSWRYWWPSMQELSTQHRTFAFDLWGFGDSSKVAANYSFEAYVELLDQFIEKLGIATPLTLVGHALGAAVSLRYASLHAENIRRVAAVALPVNGSLINERLASVDSATFLARVLGRSNEFPEVVSETRKTDQTAMNAVASQLQGFDFLSDLDRCTAPLLLIFGDQDSVVQAPPDGLHNFQISGNSRHYVSLDGCNHFPMLEQTAVFNRLLLDFLHADNNTTIAPKELWQRRTR
jgi:pimeloyl-ACP methyl ester carboxylesterase